MDSINWIAILDFGSQVTQLIARRIRENNIYCEIIRYDIDPMELKKRNPKDGVLVLNVIHGREIEIEYKKNEIMDKINSFFGYNCISNVTLKIVSNKISKKKLFPKIQNFEKIEEKMKNVKDNQLKRSLNNLLKAYNERNE